MLDFTGSAARGRYAGRERASQERDTVMGSTHSVRRPVTLLATAAASLLLALAPVLSYWPHKDTALQALADEAALAGVNALGQSAGLSEGERLDASMAATRRVVPELGEAQVRISPEQLAMTVTLADHGKPVSATAHYMPAGAR
jgi:hypothetical protein